jgi:Flp pilus assembly pilin Flp
MNSRLGTLMVAMDTALSRLGDRLRRNEGQAFVEYALVLVFVAAIVATATLWAPLRNGITDALDTVKSQLDKTGS